MRGSLLSAPAAQQAMRSGKEIAFRLRQEAASLWLLARRPSAPAPVEAPLPRLPHPEKVAAAVRGTPFAAELERLATQILVHRFPLLGLEVETGPLIAWRRDYQRGIESPLWYFRRIPYLETQRTGDHKLIWELNRHQHLVALAQAFRCFGREEYLRELFSELETWWAANPFQRGINWASALEVAFRVLSWVWIYHLAGEHMREPLRARFLTELYRHGLHLAANLSVYFSPNTHLLGEAVALHALGRLFPAWSRADKWRRQGAGIVREQMERQVREDGSHFEQSSYYHLYALDLFLFHSLLEETSAGYRNKLGAMADYLAALLGPSRTLPFLGDDDGGRLFHPYGQRAGFARATLATCGAVLGRTDLPFQPEDHFEQAVWWVGPEVLAQGPTPNPAPGRSRWFPDAGVAVMRCGELAAIIDAGPFGPGSGGHSHSDTLSVVVHDHEREILVDAGTYTYAADPQWRDWFRGAAAHNTVRVDGRSQAIPAGPFRWREKPGVELGEWCSDSAGAYLDATCRYRGIRHRRRVLLLPPDLLVILDQLEGPGGKHLLEQFWHPGEPLIMVTPRCWRVGGGALLTLGPSQELELMQGGDHGWRSVALGAKALAPVIRVASRTTLPATLAAALWFSANRGSVELELAPAEETVVRLRGGLELAVRFPARGRPAVTSSLVESVSQSGSCAESRVF